MLNKEIDKVLMKKIYVAFLAFIGFVLTIKLAIIYYDSNFNPYALPSFCSVSDLIDCDGVAKTIHSQFFGIPLAYWGMFLYLFMFMLLIVDKLKRISVLRFLKVFKHPFAYIAALGYISFTISMVLLFISLFEIKKICILCFCTYVINLFIALIATNWYTREGEAPSLVKSILAIYKCFKTSVHDFIHAIKIKKYLISFLAVLAIASAVLSYTTLSYCFTPQIKRAKSLKEFSQMENNPFKVEGNTLGDENAPLIVNIYTDFLCPICYSANLMNHRAAKELKGLKFVHHDLPLDMECNKYLKSPFHEGSCTMAKYSIAAENQGHLWDMNSELFEKQPKDEDEILKLAKSMGLDTIKLKKDANSQETAERLNANIERAAQLGIEGTPTMVINGKVYSGIKPYYELKEILIQAGASERK